MSGQIQALIIVFGGVLGAAGPICAGVTIGAAIGAVIWLLVGAVGVAAGAAEGLHVGLGLCSIGLPAGLASGLIVANCKKAKCVETREKLHKRESELSDCGNMIERCREVMRKSEEELKELQMIVNELEQTFPLL